MPLNVLKVKIYVPQETINLFGSPEESNGSVLRGAVLIKACKATKIHLLTIGFDGWTTSNGPLASRAFGKSKKSLISSQMSLLEPEGSPRHLHKGIHSFPFEFAIDGMSLETVRTRYFKTKYFLTAHVKRPKFPVITSACEVPLNRLPLEIPLGETGFISIQENWESYIKYKIQSNKNTYHVDDFITLNYTFRPLLDSLEVSTIYHYLVEYVTYYKQKSGPSTTKERTILLRTCQINHRLEGESFVLTRPEYIPSPQPDVENEHVQIKHKLHMVFVLKCGDIQNSMTVTTPIHLINGNESPGYLPTYQESQMAGADYVPPPSYHNLVHN
ncbi:hypothetical protein K493DRAFT_301501 [Basidiobolus meristosporus CBS 931.73]|uniref:Arrestin C-terminal-like domain-containing protein n=1 Tax=Basidiobolus meristosporus CBS 931.73 TaxID=1314790 RepID=A0A1Y1YCP3_9FUNG|nr:hypothetical protein K493DRAFT_301501 [Basidiobolus meristosporus CBS 931.73]|eukprot:ORX95384.1 hypothetical protein K493DRAFT_301501 [Basidiobolus meristosporus CBS 931.73]